MKGVNFFSAEEGEILERKEKFFFVATLPGNWVRCNDRRLHKKNPATRAIMRTTATEMPEMRLFLALVLALIIPAVGPASFASAVVVLIPFSRSGGT